MKNLLISLLFLTSGYIFSNPVWVEYYIKVDSPKAAGKIVQATDNLMSSDYVKKNFKGQLERRDVLTEMDYGIFWDGEKEREVVVNETHFSVYRY